MQSPYQSSTNRRFATPTLFLAVALSLVYGLPFQALPLKAEKRVNEKAEIRKGPEEILRDLNILPPEAARIRRTILQAAASGDIEALRIPVEMNEIPPLIGPGKPTDPIAYWKEVSGDGEGREILAILIELFRTGFVRTGAGTGDELYVWPYFAEVPLDRLTPGQMVELLTIVPPERVERMMAAGRYDYYRIGIAHDGTWHYFMEEAD